jgi:hypothetical protein
VHHAVGSSRLTVDVDVTCATVDHLIARLDRAVVVETKDDSPLTHRQPGEQSR